MPSFVWESEIESLPSESTPKAASRIQIACSSLSSLSCARTYTSRHSIENANPRTLRQLGGMRYAWLVWDIVLCLVPVYILVMAGMVGMLSGQRMNEYGQQVIEWSMLGPTIFPIFFAGIVGRTMKFMAQFRLERGSSIDTLEKLIGSQSVFSAIMTQASLARFGPTSLAILTLWAFSPLGGQASLRIIRTEYQTIIETADFAYLNMTRQITAFAAGYNVVNSQYAVDALYTGCLIGPTAVKNGSQDNWGNVKIPKIETLNSFESDEGWVDVPENVIYSSLLGVPVSGIPDDKNSSFTIESYYHNINCTSVYAVNATGDWLTPLGIPYTSQYNTTTIFGIGSETFYLGTYTDETTAQDAGNNSSPVELVLLSRSSNCTASPDVTHINVALCYSPPCFVQSNVQCQVPLMQGFPETFSIFATGLAGATAVTDHYSTPTEHYLFGEEEYPFAHGLEMVDLHNVSTADLSRRFGQIINIYWLASLAPEASTGNLPQNASALLSGDTDGQVNGNDLAFAATGTNAIISYLEEVYYCNRAWLGAVIVSSLLLFVAAVSGTAMKYHTLGPGVLGYVSTMVANNPHTREAASRCNSTMDGLERARVMQGFRIRLEDVREREQIGHIAIAGLMGRGKISRRLKAGRLYI